ncbi:NHL repeat-containing protein [Acrasis kona]|uniref:NHL repeat-containing protein n=1 Tax=Acrasis kona TaxID=1008807 RepID=A0AAW2ZBK3_9EUKA
MRNLAGLILLLCCLSVEPQAAIINTFAGNGFVSYSGENVLGTTFQVTSYAVAYDSSKSLLYFTNLHRVQVLDCVTGLVNSIAGTAIGGYNGDNIIATNAQLNSPKGIVVDIVNNLVYIADSSNNRIRVVNRTTNIISTFAGTGAANYNGDSITSTSAQVFYPLGIAIDNVNNLVYIVDGHNHRIRVVNRTNNIISTFAGTGTIGYNGDNINASSAQLDYPYGIAVDIVNNLVYIADSSNNRIRVVNRTNNIISTFAGTGTIGYNGDGITVTNAQLFTPSGLTIDIANNLVYIVDYGNHRIRVVNRTNNIISTFAGTGAAGYNGDGITATSAQLFNPSRVSFDNVNNIIFIADNGNKRIRSVVVSTNNKVINTLIGTGFTIFSGDLTLAINAQLDSPWDSPLFM